MKNLLLISSLLVSNLIFSQEKEISFETSTSVINQNEIFQVVLPVNQNFHYLSPKEITVYNNTAKLGIVSEDTNNVKKAIDLKGSSLDRFYDDVKNRKAQIISGYYNIKINSK